MEILNELNALELLYRPHYPTIRLYVTNSRYSLWDITRWKRGIANTDFTCIINFNQEFEVHFFQLRFIYESRFRMTKPWW